MANANTAEENLSENAEILLARTRRQGSGLMAYTSDDVDAIDELVDAGLITANILLLGHDKAEYHCRPV